MRGTRLKFAMLLGFAIVLVGGLVALHLQHEYAAVLALWEARETSLAEDRGRMVSDWLQERQNDAEALAGLAQVIAALEQGTSARPRAPGGLVNAQKLARSLDRFARPYGYSAIYVLNLEGQLVGQSTGAPELEAAGRSIRPEEAAKGRGQIYLLGNAPENSLLSLSAPVFAEVQKQTGGTALKPRGAIVLRIRLARSLFPLLLSEPVPTRTGETVLYRKEGNEVVMFSPLRHLATGDTGFRRAWDSAPLPARLALEGKKTFGQFTDYRGVRVLAAADRIPLTGWGLVRKIDRAEALEHFRRAAWIEVLAAALLVAVFGVLAFAYWRYAENVTVKREQERFRALVLATSQIVWTTSPEGEVEDIPEWRAFTGQTLEQIRGWGWLSALHPDDRERTTTAWREALKNRSLYDTEYRLRRHDGEFRYFSARGAPVLNSQGSVREWVGFCADIQERKQAEQELRRLNRALRTISECNKALVKAQEEPVLLRDICRILVEEGGYRLAWVGCAEQDEARSVRPVAQWGADDGYLAEARISWADNERGRGPTGKAVRLGRPFVARRTSEEPDYDPWRAAAQQHGFASSIALPLALNSHTLGAFTLYSSQPDAFDEAEVKLLSELVSDLSFGIGALRTRAAGLRTEEAVRRANAYNRRLIEASLDPLVTIAQDGKITDVNHATESATGHTRAELIGTDFCDYFTDPAKARAGYEQVFREGFVQDYELEICHREGHLTPVLYNATVYRDEGGSIQGVFAAARDITEKKRAQQGVEAERQRFNNIFESLPAYLVLLTPDYHVPFANRFFRERFGESKGRRCYEYLFGRTEPCEICETFTVLKTGGPHHWEWTGPDQRNYDIHDFPFTDADGSPLILEMGIDITERRKAEQEVLKLNEGLERRVLERTAELEAANKELEAFTYSVSHDLRAPLRHVDGFSKLLVDEFKAELPPKAQEYVDVVRESVKQMGTLIDDLLNLGRVGRKELRVEVTGLNSLVTEVVQELTRANPQRSIEWKIRTLPFVECDPALMKLVFSNLLSNAVKFTRPRHPAIIEVATTRRDGRPAVFVRDNGVGFSMKYVDKLFGVFQRLHRVEDFEGTGVGLATVQRIIHKHGGQVWAEGELDKGATFYFTLGAPGAP